MSYLKEIIKICYQYGDLKNDYRIALNNVWLRNSVGDINVYIKNGELHILTYNGFDYTLSSLMGKEQCSILDSLEKYVDNVNEMLNKKNNLEVSF